MLYVLLFILVTSPLFCAAPQDASVREEVIHSSRVATWYLVDDITLASQKTEKDNKGHVISMKNRTQGTHIFVRRLKPQDFHNTKQLVPACAFHKDTYDRITQSYVLLEHAEAPPVTKHKYYAQTSLVQPPRAKTYCSFGALTPLSIETPLEVKTLTRTQMTPGYPSYKAVACDEENDAHYTEELLLLPLGTDFEKLADGAYSKNMVSLQISTSQENFFTIDHQNAISEQPKMIG